MPSCTYLTPGSCTAQTYPIKYNCTSQWLSGKESAINAGDPGSIPGLEKSPREENGSPLQYSCQENLMDRGAWQAIVHGVTRVRHDLVTKPPPPPYLRAAEIEIETLLTLLISGISFKNHKERGKVSLWELVKSVNGTKKNEARSGQRTLVHKLLLGVHKFPSQEKLK